MATAHTPQNTRDPAPEANVVMSPAQFKQLLETCRPHTPQVARAIPGVEDAVPTVNSAAVKLPTFWVHDPELVLPD